VEPFFIAANEEDVELAGPDGTLFGEVEVRSRNGYAKRFAGGVGDLPGAYGDFTCVGGLSDRGIEAGLE